LSPEPDLIPATPPAGKTVLNVGCGYPLRQKLHRHFHGPEWREIRLDLDPAVQPDIVCSITDMSPVATDSVDAIWASHKGYASLYRHLKILSLCRITVAFDVVVLYPRLI
jgi:predicted SAM-dependent methyltransferase